LDSLYVERHRHVVVYGAFIAKERKEQIQPALDRLIAVTDSEESMTINSLFAKD